MEAADLHDFNIGIMAQTKAFSTRGQWAFEILQCTGTGLSVVSSLVRINAEPVVPDDTGLFVAEPATCRNAVLRLAARGRTCVVGW